ncbi:MAG: hypothetical protein JWM89_3475 [Acidimicrobiales bacterium]|nr:hypothetical protein [Acidimicrobiales bacterium]
MTRSPRPAHRVRIALVAAVSVVVLATATLAACGDGDSVGDTRPSAPQPAAPAATTTTGDGSGVTTDGGTVTPPATGTPKVDATVVASVDQPTVLLPRPGDPDHVYVAERPGRIRRLKIRDSGTLARDGDTLLDLTSDTSTDFEQGLLGLAFSADGDTIYVSRTNEAGDTRLVSYAIDDDGIDAESAKVLLAQDQPFPNHNGGNVVLGPDGKLWFGLGDGGAADDPSNNAQDPGTVLGKIVRLTPGREPEIVISGARNPWRFAFDTDGSLWIGDVGQNMWEEIDHLAPADIHGANLGWSGYEGKHEYQSGEGRRPADAIPPIFDYSHDGGNCSITGGFVYRGKAIASLRGMYLFIDYCAGDLRAIALDADGGFSREVDLGVHIDSPASFGTDQAGEAYVLSQTGSISRLVPAT